MSNIRNAKWNLKRLGRLKLWQLLVLLVLTLFLAATFLRLNNIGMVQRREAVLNADKTGNDTVTQNRLYDLQRYVAAHMNADMGTIYLEEAYKRDSQKVIDAASSDDNPNGNVFKKAQEVCAPKYASLGHYSQAYQQCVIAELNSYGSAGDPVSEVELPSTAEYRYTFASPLWSPDFAGFSVLICLLIIGVMVVRIIGYVVLKAYIKLKHRGV